MLIKSLILYSMLALLSAGMAIPVTENDNAVLAERAVRARPAARPKPRPVAKAKPVAKPKAKPVAKARKPVAAKPKPVTKAKPPVVKAKPKAAKPVTTKKKTSTPAKPAAKKKTPAPAKKPTTPAKPAAKKPVAAKPKAPATGKKATPPAKPVTSKSKTAPKKTTKGAKAPPAKASNSTKTATPPASCPVPPRPVKAKKPTKIRRWIDGNMLSLRRSLERRGILAKRTFACGINIRDTPDITRGCDANAVSFVLNAAGNAVTRTPFAQTGGVKAPNMNCDHVVELQVVGDTMQAAGLCRAIDSMLTAGGFNDDKVKAPKSAAQVKNDVFEQRIVPIINRQTNAFFLNANINQEKKNIVQEFIGRNPVPNIQIPNGNAENAVRSYFADAGVNANSQAVAQALDTAIGQVLDDIEREAKNLIDQRLGDPANPNTRLQGACGTANQQVDAARAPVANYGQAGGPPNVQQVWNAILNI